MRTSSHLPPYILGKLAHASFADLCRWITQYRNIPAKLAVPPKMSCVEMIVTLFPDVTRSTAELCRQEFLRDYHFSNALDEKMVERRHRRVHWTDWHEFLYMAVRFLKPRIAFETGVFDGQSSAIILCALNRNGQGELVSIDLPAREAIEGSTDCMPDTTLPWGLEPGWIVPEGLREHYHLVLGDSKELLLQMLSRYPNIDLFFHDSLHTFKHMFFEFTTAWPHLSEGALLLSDDILWNSAFYRFCKEVGKRYVRLEGFGAVRK